MSSLLQFGGRIKNGKVGLLFQLEGEEYTCQVCGHSHPKLWEAFRRPRGMFGHWVIFMYNGEEHVPDLSVPITVEKLPRDTNRVDCHTSNKYWHS